LKEISGKDFKTVKMNIDEINKKKSRCRFLLTAILFIPVEKSKKF